MENKIIISDEEKILMELDGDCWATPEIFFTKFPGYFIFSDKRLYFASESSDSAEEGNQITFALPYKEIKSVRPFPLNAFVPTGIDIRLKNRQRYKIALKDRVKYIDFLKAKMKE